MLCLGFIPEPVPCKWELVKLPSSLDTVSQREREGLQTRWVKLPGVLLWTSLLTRDTGSWWHLSGLQFA